MKLGAFSVSLAVKDLKVSMEFYSKLGFEKTGGDGEAWAILINGNTVIGLFQGMFDKNMLTFNPGWSGPHQKDDGYTDVRELRAKLAEAGIEIADDGTTDKPAGPAHITVIDPDGNPILLDQHV